MNNLSNFTSFLLWIFNHQSQYSVDTQAWTQETLFTNLAADTKTATGVNSSLVLEGLYNTTYTDSVDHSWQFGAKNAITGTPIYMLNGVIVPELTEIDSTQDWANFFNSL